MGIGMVAPAKMMHDILNQEALVKRRDESNRAAHKLAQDKGFKADSVEPDKDVTKSLSLGPPQGR
jgi:hypothetical protein